MAESKNNPNNRRQAPVKLTDRICACDDNCGERIPARDMLTVMSTKISETGKVNRTRRYVIRDHYKAA